jgi:hypothetical protein
MWRNTTQGETYAAILCERGETDRLRFVAGAPVSGEEREAWRGSFRRTAARGLIGELPGGHARSPVQLPHERHRRALSLSGLTAGRDATSIAIFLPARHKAWT